MNKFIVNICIRIIHLDEDSKMYILVDNEAKIPSFQLDGESHISSQLHKEIAKFIYENDLHLLLSTETLSNISNNIDDNIVNITYNYISNNKMSRCGRFVEFNEHSLELYRLAISSR